MAADVCTVIGIVLATIGIGACLHTARQRWRVERRRRIIRRTLGDA